MPALSSLTRKFSAQTMKVIAEQEGAKERLLLAWFEVIAASALNGHFTVGVHIEKYDAEVVNQAAEQLHELGYQCFKSEKYLQISWA